MEWIDINEKLPLGAGDVLMAKRENGDICKCYYHADSMIWLASYGIKTSKFQRNEKPHEFFQDVTHWMSLSSYSED